MAHADGFVITGGAQADNPRVNAIGECVVNHAYRSSALDLDTDCDRMCRITVDEVCRSIQRIEDPADAGIALKVRAFLAYDFIVRSCRAYDSDESSFGLAVNLRDKIGRRCLRVDFETPLFDCRAMDVT